MTRWRMINGTNRWATKTPDGAHPTRECDRCGITREIRPGRDTTGLCRDCHTVDPHCFTKDNT